MFYGLLIPILGDYVSVTFQDWLAKEGFEDYHFTVCQFTIVTWLQNVALPLGLDMKYFMSKVILKFMLLMDSTD